MELNDIRHVIKLILRIKIVNLVSLEKAQGQEEKLFEFYIKHLNRNLYINLNVYKI